MAGKLGTIYVSIAARMGAFKRDLAGARTQSLRTSKYMSKQFDMVKASMIGLAGAAGIGMVVKSVIRMGMQFQQSMAVVRGVTRATEKEFLGLQNIAKKLGETTEWTASQAADALKFLGMAGFSANKAMKALPGTLDLATAGNIGLGQAADIATNALTAMQLEVGQLGRVNDVFVATITRSNTNMEMMAESFRYAAPVAKAYGISIERLSALIGTLGNAGIQGSMAGTQLAFGFQKAARVFKELGMDGTGKDMVDALEAANKAGWDSAKMMQVFGMRGGRAALVLRNLVPEIKEFEEKLKGSSGEAKELADVMRSTVSFAFKELKSAIEGIAIEAFSQKQSDLQESIKKLTEAVRNSKDGFISLATGMVTVTEKFVKLSSTIINLSTKIPPEIAAGVAGGLIGRVLFGKGGAGPIIGSLVMLDQLLDKLGRQTTGKGLGVGGAIESYKELDKAMRALTEVITGKRHWDTGLPIQAMNRITEEFDEMHTAFHTATSDVEDFGYALSTEMQQAEKSIKSLDDAISAVFAEIEKESTPSELAKSILGDIDKEQKRQIESTQAYLGQLRALFRKHEDELSGIREKPDEKTKLVQEKYLQETEDFLNLKKALFRKSEDELSGIREQADEGTLESQQIYLDGLKEQYKETSDYMLLLSERTSNAMEQNFSNFFFDAMQGEMKSFEDYMVGVFDSISRAFSDILGQMVAEWIKTQLKMQSVSAAGGGFGGAMSWIAGLFGGVGGPGPVVTGGNPAEVGFARGGIIDKPTIFPFASGIGLAGESGPEGILPLKRIGGNLGVSADGTGSTINKYDISIHAVDAASFSELLERNPEAIISQVTSAADAGHGGLRQSIRDVIR